MESRIVAIEAAAPDIFMSVATPKFAARAIGNSRSWTGMRVAPDLDLAIEDYIRSPLSDETSPWKPTSRDGFVQR
jgi:hypothetical protein